MSSLHQSSLVKWISFSSTLHEVLYFFPLWMKYKCTCSPHVICLHTAHTPSLHVHASHLHTLVICCLLHTKKQKRAPWCKHFASIWHAHSEALLHATSAIFNSYHRGSVSHFEEEAELTEEDEHDYKLPSYVTVKT